MRLQVEIDAHSGFCGGVIRAITRAEDFLSAHPDRRLYSVGAIVHNEAELERLSSRGLRTVSCADLSDIPGCREDVTLLIRAHGEPPSTYRRAREAGFEVVDCTCPVVLRLQERIRQAYARLQDSGGQIVLFGKVGHAEVLGLVGQVDGDVLVVENVRMLEEALGRGAVSADGPLEIFSQTTKSPGEYEEICRILRAYNPSLTVHHTICSQVASRHAQLSDFAASHDVVVFVSGQESSNGKVLFDLCRAHNPRTSRCGSPDEIRPEWFRDGDRVGVCGATSTPKWLLEAVAQKILQIN